MTSEWIAGGKMHLTQGEGVFPLSMDSLLLGDFASLRRNRRVCDLGCGSGVLGLLLFAREPEITYAGYDCDGAACALTRTNLAENGLEGRVTQLDFSTDGARLPANSADLAISNPPYFQPQRGAVTAGVQRCARAGCSLSTLCTCAARVLVPGGRFALIYPAEGLSRLFAALTACRLEPKRLRLVQHSPTHPPKLALVESVLDGRAGLQMEPTLLLHDPDGTESAEYRRIYHI